MKRIKLPGSSGERKKLLMIILIAVMLFCYAGIQLYRGMEGLSVPDTGEIRKTGKELLNRMKDGFKNNQ